MAIESARISSLDSDASHEAPSPFDRIVCGVDGSRGALEAVRQAGLLAGAGSTIELIAVADGRGATDLQEATDILGDCVAHVSARTVEGHPAWQQLLDASRGADLLAVGRHGNSRAGGITSGSTATKVVHHARLPLLVAHEPPAGATFPGRILVAADGPGHPENAVRLAGKIACHAGARDITLLRLDWSRRPRRPEIAEAMADVVRVTGIEPVEVMLGGAPHRRISEEAEHETASLIIMGTRDLTGVHALRSVSERVAHEAPCSVLIVHGPYDG